VKPIAFVPLLAVLVMYILRIRELGVKRGAVPGKVLERTTLRAFVVAGSILLGGSVIEFVLRGCTVNAMIFCTGLVCAMISFWLRRNAIQALGRFWSLHVEIREQHEFVENGPFRWVRHPTYLSMILELLAGALMLNAFFTLAAVLILFVPILLFRVRIEEAALVEKFGQLYCSYQKRTPAIFPYKWPVQR